MDLGLKDRVAIVTGGNRGIGYAISAELLKEGAHVVVASLDPARNAEAIGKLKGQSNGRVIGPWPMPTAPKAEVSTTRRTPASRAARSTRRLPSTAGTIQSSSRTWSPDGVGDAPCST